MFNIQSSPMQCCGMIAGQGFDCNELTPAGLRYANDALITKRLAALEARQSDESRSCAIITLSSDQDRVIAIAKNRGWKEIHSFYNPNSGNQCYIYTLTIYEDRDSYRNINDLDNDDV